MCSSDLLKATCEAALQRLRTEVIDLYYLHRWDKTVPIEDSVGALAELVREGKIRAIGLSEVSSETLRRAHAVRPSAMLEEGAWGVSVLELGYQDKQFQNDRFAFNSTRSGKNWRLNLTQYAYFAGRSGYVRLGYTYDVDATGGDVTEPAPPGDATCTAPERREPLLGRGSIRGAEGN